MKFRKKPVEVEAFRYGHEEMPNWMSYAHFWHDIDGLVIKTLEGDMLARHGDWIIKGVKGEIYPCKPEIFDMTYDSVA